MSLQQSNTWRVLSNEEVRDIQEEGGITPLHLIRHTSPHYVCPTRRFEAGSALDRRVKWK